MVATLVLELGADGDDTLTLTGTFDSTSTNFRETGLILADSDIAVTGGTGM